LEMSIGNNQVLFDIWEPSNTSGCVLVTLTVNDDDDDINEIQYYMHINDVNSTKDVSNGKLIILR